MKNYVSSGKKLPLTAPYARTSGQGMLVGSVFGVCTTDVASGAECTAYTRGAFDLAKAAGAVTQGQKIYWDDTAHQATTTATANTLIGVATQAQASGDATVRVLLGIV